MGGRRPWDLLVIGGGAAGLAGAYAAAEIGARVALVERDRTGGDCLWTGCVPSKALIAAAAQVATARRAAGFGGAKAAAPPVDLAAVMHHVHSSIATIEPLEDSPEALRAAGVTVLRGHAVFTGDDHVEVGRTRHAFRHALLATGASPALPDVAGLVEAEPLTTHTIWGLRRLPSRLTVIGGGPVGCELSQAFARLGSAVTLIEASPRLLPREDPDASAVVQRALIADGVDVLLGTRPVKVVADAGEPGEVHTDDGAQQRTVAYQALLVATGRRARTTGLGLDRLGVQLTPQGAVVVTDTLRTSHPRVWAAGDVTPFPHLTHLAGYHGALAAANALLGLRRSIDLSAVPRVVYTDPEVATVGAPTWSAVPHATPRVVTRTHDHVHRAVADGRTDGFSRLTLNARGTRIVGATIVGPRAGESIAELTLAVRARMTLTDYAATVHAYPTYADGPWNAAIDQVRLRLAQPAAQRASRAWLTVRRSGAALRRP
jgi:pyruvate/2-oxoglutarate dehydrogenase complex dihydrolipoamide dehydrogenase (E3) component